MVNHNKNTTNFFLSLLRNFYQSPEKKLNKISLSQETVFRDPAFD